MNHVRYCGAKEQERMTDNGWIIKLPMSCCETDSEMFCRLSKEYTKVKIYYDTTAIRGLHKYFAMVK